MEVLYYISPYFFGDVLQEEETLLEEKSLSPIGGLVGPIGVLSAEPSAMEISWG